MKIEELRFLAFRYALGRRTYVVSRVVNDLIKNWDSMSFYHKQIQNEVEQAIRAGWAGDAYDEQNWREVLALDTVKMDDSNI